MSFSPRFMIAKATWYWATTEGFSSAQLRTQLRGAGWDNLYIALPGDGRR